jgi:hypothetical protein
MTIDIAEEPMTALAEYARLPIAFPVDHVLGVTARTDGGSTCRHEGSKSHM